MDKKSQAKSSDSLTSLCVWSKNRAPPIYSNAQTGSLVEFPELLLFSTAMLLLVLGLGLFSASIWSLLYRSRYSLLDISTDLAYFDLPIAFFCLLCFWVVLSVHNDEKSYRFLSLVLIMMTFVTVLLIIAVYIGLNHKLNLKHNQIDNSSVLTEFRETLKGSMNRTEIWDNIQTKLGCCGVDNYTDWLSLNQQIPESCYQRKASCRDNSTSSTGCLKIITTVLALQTCLFSGINCVALFIQFWAFIILAATYFSSRKQD